MTVVSMSAKEFSRLDVLMDLEARRMTVRDACDLLRLKRRQVFRLLKDFRAAWCGRSRSSKRRGKPGNNRLPQSVRDLVMTLIKERYARLRPDPGELRSCGRRHGCPGVTRDGPHMDDRGRSVAGSPPSGFLLFTSRAIAASAWAS